MTVLGIWREIVIAGHVLIAAAGHVIAEILRVVGIAQVAVGAGNRLLI
jgi:hypothetical protein